jgi:hypothetical protein
MPNIVVPLTPLVVNTPSASVLAAGSAIAAADTFEIDCRNRTDDLVLVFQNTGAGNSVITVNAGVDPPSKREGIGNLVTPAIATTECRVLTLEGGRFIQANGKITGSVATNGVRAFAFRIPRKS